MASNSISQTRKLIYKKTTIEQKIAALERRLAERVRALDERMTMMMRRFNQEVERAETRQPRELAAVR